ncbi:hypothetical protein JT358_12355 [Micrococcales bacterium 31B]|nr:hypothetical protein [Micrococcales bacterium 31B]
MSSLDRSKSRRLLFEPGSDTLVVRSTDNASINLVQDQITLFCDDLDLLELQLLKLEIVTSF